MIYTVGFQVVKGVHLINSNEVQLQNVDVEKDVIFVKASGSTREKWIHNPPFSTQFFLEGVFPNREQSNQIESFLFSGGTVISSLEYPEKKIQTVAYSQEISNQVKENTEIKIDGDIVEIEYRPYNWLNGDLTNYPKEAYEISQKRSELRLADARVNTGVTSVLFSVGKGTLIFTTLMNEESRFKTIEDFQDILHEITGKEQAHVIAG